MAHNQLGQAYLQKHMYDQAIAELQKAVQLSGVARRASPILLVPILYPARGAKR